MARIESVHLLLALAAQEGWEVHHMDVKSAFLNGDLLEEVYVKQHDGFVVRGQEEKVLHLDKALYGLRQEPRAWNTKLDRTLMDLKFQCCDSDHSVYACGHGSHRLLVGVYVDDLVIAGNSNSEIVKFKLEMKDKFQMSDLGLLSYYLGLEVSQTEDGITITQAAYAQRILDRVGMNGCNPSHTPMEHRLKLSKKCSSPPVSATTIEVLLAASDILCIPGLIYFICCWLCLSFYGESYH